MNDNLSKRIQQATLTKGQHRIADYVLKNQNRICTMTSLAVAREAGVSDASIIRFSRAIGYEGFAALKQDLYNNLTQDLFFTDVGDYSPDKRMDIQSGKFKNLNLASELLKLLLHNVEQSLRQNDLSQYTQAVSALVKGRRKIILGLRGAKSSAFQFARLLEFFMDQVETFTSGDSDDVARLRGLQKGDVVFAITYARYYKVDALLAEITYKRGATLIVLTDSMRSPLAQKAQIIFLVETKHMGFSNSIVGTACVLEYLLTLLCWKYPQEYQERLKERDLLLHSLLLEN